MATRIMDEINKLDDMQKLPKLKLIRKTVKFQLTKVNKWIDSATKISYNEINSRRDSVNNLRCKFEMIQDNIDILTEEDNLHTELNYRGDMEGTFISPDVKLQHLLQSTEGTRVIIDLNTNSNLTTSNLHFLPYDERETFSNFVKRLDIFMKLKNISDASMKTYSPLYALTPLLYQKVYDLCAPDDPSLHSYEELVSILKKYLDPQASVLALQHKFITREQRNGETINEFSMELRRLSVECQFNCTCGKSEYLKQLGLKENWIETTIEKDQSGVLVKSYLMKGMLCTVLRWKTVLLGDEMRTKYYPLNLAVEIDTYDHNI